MSSFYIGIAQVVEYKSRSARGHQVEKQASRDNTEPGGKVIKWTLIISFEPLDPSWCKVTSAPCTFQLYQLKNISFNKLVWIELLSSPSNKRIQLEKNILASPICVWEVHSSKGRPTCTPFANSNTPCSLVLSMVPPNPAFMLIYKPRWSLNASLELKLDFVATCFT